MSAPLPFTLRPEGDGARLALADHEALGSLRVDLELELPDAGGATGDGATAVERFQRRRTRLGALSLRVDQRALDRHLAGRAAALAREGVTQVVARIGDGEVSVTARIADGLASADVSFQVGAVARDTSVRLIAGAVRVHGHLPTPAPLIAHRVLELALGGADRDRPDGLAATGLCEIELDAVAATLWRLLPGAGWRLPATAGVGVSALRASKGVLIVTYAAGPSGELATSPATRALAIAHEAMRSADDQARKGMFDDAMRGYRALLAAAGPDQPVLLERILAIAAARPSWFVDGLELARQALARWPDFAAAHAALASIALAKGDASEAAARLTALSDVAARAHDGAAAALAALAAARLLRVLDPAATTPLYERVLTVWPDHDEAGVALADRLADEQRWRDLARTLEARARAGTDGPRAARAWAQAAITHAEALHDLDRARVAVTHALALGPQLPFAHEARARVAAAAGDPATAVHAWAAAAEAAAAAGDHGARLDALTARAHLLVELGDPVAAAAAWQDALALDPDRPDSLRGAAAAAAGADDHARAIELYTHFLAVAEDVDGAIHLALGRSHVARGELDAAFAAFERAAAGQGPIAAEALAAMAELRQRDDRGGAAAAFDRAIEVLLASAGMDDRAPAASERAAELALARARLLEADERLTELRRAHHLASGRAPGLARQAAIELLAAAREPADARPWIDAILDAEPTAGERAGLLVRRAELRLAASPPELAAAADDAELAAELAPSADLARAAGALRARVAAAAGDPVAHAQALARIAELSTAAERPAAIVAGDHAAAAAAWIAADDAGAALRHAQAAVAALPATDDAAGAAVDPALRARVHLVLGEAAWRQRAFAEVARAYEALLADDDGGAERPIAQLRLAVAAERRGEAAIAIALLDRAAPVLTGDAQGQAYRLLAELHEKKGDPLAAAAALEAYASAPDIGIAPRARADAFYRAGELFRRSAGHADSALRCLEAAVRLVDDHLPALDALELIERDLGDLDRVATILGRKIAACARQPGRQKALLCRLAALQEQLARPDVARMTLQRALEIDPGYRPALRALGELARARGDTAELAEQLARLAEPTGDDGDTVREQVAAAIELATLVADEPSLAGWRDRAQEVCDALHDDAGAAQAALLEAVARLRTGAPGEAPASGPARAAAEVARSGGDLPRARALLEEAATAGDVRVLRELADVCADQGDWEAAARHLEELAARLDDGSRPVYGHRKAEVLLELADLYYDRIGDLTRARGAMRAAAAAHGPSARRDATLRLLAAEAAAAEDHLEAATALEAIAADRRTAADVLALATAWQRGAHDHKAIAVLEDVQAQGRMSDEAAMLLFALHQEKRRKAEFAAALERSALGVPPAEARARLTDALGLYRDALGDAAGTGRVEGALAALPPSEPAQPAAPPRPSAERRRTQRPTEIERLAEEAATTGDLKGAADLYADAIAARVRAGSDPALLSAAIERVRDTARAAGHSDALVRALFAVAGRAPQPLAVELYREAAVTARSDLDDDIAVDALTRAHQLAPSDGELVAALADILEARGEFAHLADVYERAARATVGADRARWLLALALLCRDRLGDLRRARQHLDAAHATAPDLATVWLLLADARMADDDVAGARELYERAADSPAVDDATRAWAAERLDALSRDPEVVAGEMAGGQTARLIAPPPEPIAPAAGAGDGAGDGDGDGEAPPPPVAKKRITLRGISGVHRAPSHDDSGPHAIEATEHDRELRMGAELAQAGQVEAAIARYEAATSLAPPGDLRALTALELLYAHEGDAEAVSDAIGRQIVATAEPRLRARLWRRRAQLYRDVLHREAETYRCLKEAHAADPDDTNIAYELRAVAMARGEWSLTADLIQREIAAAGTARDRGALHLELALVYDEKLLDPEQARVHYETAITYDPGIPAVPRPLARIYELAGRYRDAADLLEQAAPRAAAADRPALLARAAADAARAGQRERAVELSHAAAAAADEVGNREAAGRARAEAARLTAEPEHDAAMAREAAEREAELTRAIAAADGAAMENAARNLVALQPGHPHAFRILFERAEARSDWAAAADLLSSRASAEADPTEQASQWFELGRLHLERRADPRAARAAWERALAADAGFAPALDALAELAYRERDLATAADLYARLPVNASRLPGEVLMLRRAELAEALGDDARALTLAQGAARINPSRRDVYATCARLAQKLGDLDAAIRASRSALELIVPDDVEAVTAARYDLAELCRRAGDTIGAVYYHELVLAEEPHHARALEALTELYVERGNWGGAARALRTLAGLTGAPDRKAALLHRLGELTLARLGDVAAADDAFLRASDLDPAHVPTLRRLIDVYWRADDPAALLDVAQDLHRGGNLLDAQTGKATLARALVTAASQLAMNLASSLATYLADETAPRVAAALTELVGRSGELTLEVATGALADLAQRGHGPPPVAVAAAARTGADPAGVEVARAFGA
ncbi:MAG TPA: hypothetical protein VM734_04595 [Kofleriaceae bacterium]|nr:hypothetical protein [Kofleriaceae bacterium]